MNGDTVLGMIYEDDKYGRTMVIQEKINLAFPVYLYDVEKFKKLEEDDFSKQIWKMIPNAQ